MDTTELLKRVQTVEIKTRRLVSEVMTGSYTSAFRGRGMEFDEVRAYVAGDDVRAIDWNVTARTGSPHIKRFVEERELTVMLVVDVSASNRFGSGPRFKSDLIAELSALLSFSASRSSDKVGLMLFSDKVETYVPPRKGRRHALRILRELIAFDQPRAQTNIGAALEYLGRVLRRKAVVFLISDFQDRGYEKALRLCRRRHDLISVTVGDPREEELPSSGLLELVDPESGQTLQVDAGSKSFRERFSRQSLRRSQARAEAFRQARVDQLPVRTDKPYIESLRAFFAAREKRRGR